MDMNHQIKVLVDGVETKVNTFNMKFFWKQPRSGIILDDGLKNTNSIIDGVTVNNT